MSGISLHTFAVSFRTYEIINSACCRRQAAACGGIRFAHTLALLRLASLAALLHTLTGLAAITLVQVSAHAHEQSQPFFGEPLSNLTIPLGRDAIFQCVVHNLNGYQVSVCKTRRSLRSRCR